MQKLFVAVFATLLVLLLQNAVYSKGTNPAYAQTKLKEVLIEVPKVEVQVDHVANIFEKLKEKVTLFFKFSKEGKYNYQKYLVEKRLSELKYVVESKQGNFIEETSSRYSTYLGTLSSFVIDNKLSGKKENILTMFNDHIKAIEKLQENYGSESVFRMLLQHDINTIKLFTTKLKDNL